jgi:hypothetical protein
MKASQKERKQIISLKVCWPYIGWEEEECQSSKSKGQYAGGNKGAETAVIRSHHDPDGAADPKDIT